MWKFASYKVHYASDIGGSGGKGSQSGGTVADWQIDGGELVHCFADPTAVPHIIVATIIKSRVAEILYRATNPLSRTAPDFLYRVPVEIDD